MVKSWKTHWIRGLNFHLPLCDCLEKFARSSLLGESSWEEPGWHWLCCWAPGLPVRCRCNSPGSHQEDGRSRGAASGAQRKDKSYKTSILSCQMWANNKWHTRKGKTGISEDPLWLASVFYEVQSPSSSRSVLEHYKVPDFWGYKNVFFF